LPWARIISGIVAIAVALSAIILGGWYFAALFSVLVYLAELEYIQLVRAKGFFPAAKTIPLISLGLIVAAALHPAIADAAVPLAGTFVCFYLLFRPKMASIADLSASVMGIFYCGYLPSYWVRLRVGTGLALEDGTSYDLPLHGFWPHDWLHPDLWPPALTVTLLAFGCIWAADIGAYVMGKWLGRTPLSDISPKKTIEGSVFGIGGSALLALGGAAFLDWPLWQASGILFGLLVGVASLLGDLIESLMKRDAGVKDSGQLIPGHGGVLDRTDSYIFTGPIVYYFVTAGLPWLATWLG
jgi:phosphatidate cytidylyltransferase